MGGQLTQTERRALQALADTLVPASPGVEGLEASASELGTVERAERIITEVLIPPASAELRRFLRLVENRFASLLLAGRLSAFSELEPHEREAYLLALAGSVLREKRRAFNAVKRIVGFAHYTHDATWPALGYAGPPASDEPPATGPELPTWDGQRVEVIVVGSGSGGGVAAGVLAKAGLDVLVIERGGYHRPAELSGREDAGSEQLYDRSSAFTTKDDAITLLAGRAVGGGTTVNWMTSLEPPLWLRREWQDAGVDGAADGGFAEHVKAVTDRAHVSTDESDLNGANRILRDGAVTLGYEEGTDWRRIPRNARGCRSRCDHCVYGCPWNAKQGTLVTWLADAAANGARFLVNAHVERVLIERGQAVGVELADGRQVRANTVVVAAGAVRTAALLLRSGVRSRGLGRLYIHPATSVASVHDEPVGMWRGPMQTIMIDRFANLDGQHHGPRLEAVPAHPGLSGANLPWHGGREAKEDMANFEHTAALLVLMRDERPGRVTSDRDGRPVVHYRVGPADARRMVRGMVELARVQRAAGARRLLSLHARDIHVDADERTGRIDDASFDDFVAQVERAGVRPHALALFTAHQMGTCAIGRDGEAPADGATGRVWDVEGLYVMDGSAFPSASGVNPMITIMSLAHRNATRLARGLRSGSR